MANFDVIERDIESIPEVIEPQTIKPEPLIIRGSGNITLFGLSNSFCPDFPGRLIGKVAKEEFNETMNRINGVLSKQTPVNFRWMLCGCVFCCCTMGCSMWPVCCLNKRTRRAVEKALDWENIHLYNKLGMQWRLAKQRRDATNMSEYVLVLDFLPKAVMMLPD